VIQQKNQEDKGRSGIKGKKERGRRVSKKRWGRGER
jgi:hypothetical protein